MGSISGLSGSAGGASSLRGFGGLASGMDRDSLIESMTYATRSKIAQQKQKKDTLGWKQTAMRSITSKMHEFSSKYASYSSPSNLLGSKLFSRTQITASGDNSKYLSVSGTGTASSSMSVLGVKQLAQNSQISTLKQASNQTLSTGGMKLKTDSSVGAGDLLEKVDVSLVAGQSIGVKYGNKSYSIVLKDGKGYDYSTHEATVDSINKAMKEVAIGNGKTLGDVMKVEYTAADPADPASKKYMSFKSMDTAGNTLEITGGSGNIMQNLGFAEWYEQWGDLPEDRRVVTSGGLKAKNEAEVVEEKALYQVFSGKQISFAYNGTTKWIQLDYFGVDSKATDVEASLQKKLNEAFGTNRIEVNLDNKTIANDDGTTSAGFGFSFKTMKPDGTGGASEDPSSTLAITAADRGLMGNMGILSIQAGTSNRMNLSSDIMRSGLKGVKGAPWVDGAMDLTINGKTIQIKQDETMSDIINKINSDPDMKVNIAYQSNSDRFILTSKEKGASGDITLGGAGAELLFGATSTSSDKDDHFKKLDGKDAIVFVKYAGSNKPTEITRDSNTLTVDGLNITLKGTFGYSDSTLAAPIDETQTVTFDARVDADNTTKVVKEMITAYNEMLEMINKEVSQKPNRNYQPLTDEQKAEMSEDQIEKWEEEAKKGLFFNNGDLRSLTDKMRFVMPTQDRAALSRMGITASTDYNDNGKLVFDEEKFKTALNSDPDAVKEVFIREESSDGSGNKIEGGLMTKMKSVMDQYARMTGSVKGILVEQAGSIYAPTSILSNNFQKQIDSIDTYIDKLTDKLKMEQSRYIAQFSSLESLISKMNSQSSYLSGMTGGM